jgi:hypothetical protein
VFAEDALSLREELADVRTPVALRIVPDVLVTGSVSRAAPGTADTERPPTTESARQNRSLAPAAVEAWLTKADELLRRGDVSGARLALQPAIEAGSGLGTFKLAETYDPKRLSEWQVIGLRADAGKARDLYELALANGFSSAGERLAAFRP